MSYIRTHPVKWLVFVLISTCAASLLVPHTALIQNNPPGSVDLVVNQPTTYAGSLSMQSPMSIQARFAAPPEVGQKVNLIIELYTRIAAPDTQVSVSLSSQIEARGAQTSWQINLAAGETRRLELPVIITQYGESSITIQAIHTLPGGGTFGARQALYLEASESSVQIFDLPAKLRTDQTTPQTISILIPEENIPAPLHPTYPQDDPKLARLNAPAAPATAQGNITVYGYFFYEDNASVNHPIPYARVEIYDEESGDDELLAVTNTDHTGYYEKDVANDAADLRDIYVRIYSTDDWSVIVATHLTYNIYISQSPTVTNVPDGNHYVGQYVITGANNPAFFILDKIARDAYVYLLQQVTWVNNYNLWVLWTSNEVEEGTYYGLNNAIYLLGVHGWEEDVILHEYGHFVMDKLYSTYPPIPNCDPHDWQMSTSEGCAWSEGWATFLEGAIQGHQDYVDSSQSIHYYMEPPSPIMVSDIDEAAVAASLWDIFDPDHNEVHDSLTSGLNGSANNGLWKIVAQNQPNTIYEFWDAWFASDNGNDCAVHDILKHHLINVFDACPPSSPWASDGTYTSKVYLDWPDFPNATSYQVYRADSLAGSKTQLGVTAASNFDDNTAIPEREYYYFYKACNAVACGDYSVFETGYRSMTIPNGVSASDGAYTDKVRLTWNSVAGATYYRVFMAAAPEGPPGYLGQTSSLLYDANPATPEKPYYFWVTACNEYGCSNFSTYNAGYREMPTPEGVIASDGTYTSKIRANWNPISGATYYKVYRATSPGSQAYLADSSDAYYDDTNAIPGRTYYYYIQAYNSYGSGLQSAYDSGWREMAVPTGFSASDGDYTDKVRITWSSVYGADIYYIYRAETPGGATIQLGSTNGTLLEDTSGAQEKHYYYSVRACNTYRCSSCSAENEGWRELAAPASLTASDGTYADKVYITWSSVADATHYNVYGGETSAAASFLGQTSSTSFDHTGGAPERIYYYHVEACNSYGGSGYSNDDTGWRELAAPSGFSASDGTYAGRVFLDWDTSSDATYYKVYRGPTSGSLAYLSDAATTAFNDTTASPSTTYYYAVQACNAYGCGLQSSSDSGWCPIGTVTWVSASDGIYTDKVLISWNSVPNAEFYNIYRVSYYPSLNELFLGQTTGTSLNDIYANPEQVYDYYILACEDGECGNPSLYDSGYQEMPPPADIQASDGSYLAAIYISWTPPESATYIQLLRATSHSGPWQNISNSAWDGYLDTDISDGVTYYYWPRGCNMFGCSDVYLPDSGYCTSSTAHASASDGLYTNHVLVSWNSVPNATSYNVLRTLTPDDPASWVQILTAYSDLSYTAPAEIAGLQYFYAVMACGMAHGQLVCGNQIGIYDGGWRAMPAPHSVQASDGTYPGGVQVSWFHDLVNLDPGPDYFDVYRADALDGSKVYLGQQSSSPFIAPTTEAATPYYYWVAACNEYICSPYSIPDSGFTPYPVYLPVIQANSAAKQPGPLSLLQLLAVIVLHTGWRLWKGIG